MFYDSILSIKATDQTAVQIITYKDRLKSLPVIVKDDAIEFCDTIIPVFKKWIKSNDREIKAWTDLFIYYILENEFNFYEFEKINLNESLNTLIQDVSIEKFPRYNDIFFLISSTINSKDIKSIQLKQGKTKDIGSFRDMLLKKKAIEALKDRNPYVLFMLGFTDYVFGKQKNNQKAIDEGLFKLVLSANGMCEKAIRALMYFREKELSSYGGQLLGHRNIIKGDIDSKFVFDCIQNQIYLSDQGAQYIHSLPLKKQRKLESFVELRFAHLKRFIHKSLNPDQKSFYEKLYDEISQKQENQIMLHKTLKDSIFNRRVIYSILSSLAASACVFAGLDYDLNRLNSSILAGGIVMALNPFVMGGFTFYDYLSLKEPPTYDENQMQLVALCFSYIRKDKTKTAKFHAKKIINYFETNFDVSLTHAQNALNALNINLKGETLCCLEK
ncbi:MAG: hypothetical protein HEEMFOPI_01804 [Holosporales bacterium]